MRDAPRPGGASRHDPKRLDVAAYPWTTEIATRFGDLDFNFHLNNVAVAQLYEEGRVRFNSDMRRRYAVGRPRYLVARVAIDYLGEGRYPATATVAVAALKLGTTSWTAGLALFQEGVCVGLAESVMVHRGDAGPAPLPDALRTALGDFSLRP